MVFESRVSTGYFPDETTDPRQLTIYPVKCSRRDAKMQTLALVVPSEGFPCAIHLISNSVHFSQANATYYLNALNSRKVFKINRRHDSKIPV